MIQQRTDTQGKLSSYKMLVAHGCRIGLVFGNRMNIQHAAAFKCPQRFEIEPCEKHVSGKDVSAHVSSAAAWPANHIPAGFRPKQGKNATRMPANSRNRYC